MGVSRQWRKDTVRSLDPRPFALEDGDADAALAVHKVVAMQPGVTVTAISCAKEPGSPATSEIFSDFGLVLLRRGGFERRVGTSLHFVDSTTAFFARPDVTQEIRHPREGGDECTLINLSDAAIVAFAGDGVLPDGPIPTNAAIDLMHVTLMAGISQGLDTFELEDRLSRLVGHVVELGSPGRLTTNRPETERAHRRIVDRVREAVVADPGAVDLGCLAADLGHTRFHVSRVFRRVTGMTLTQHRNRLRVAQALDRLASGEKNLANLAADLGFADQSHLARVLRAAVGEPPSRLRERLSNVAEERDGAGQTFSSKRRGRPAA